MNPHDPHEPDTLPPELIDALRGCDPAPIEPSATHDDALLAGARAHLAQVSDGPSGAARQTGGSYRILAYLGAGGAVAAAAALGLAFWIGQGQVSPRTSAPLADNDAATPTDRQRPTDAGPDQPPPLPGDLDDSGTLDILDAFALARAVENDSPAARAEAHDFNQDGTIDKQDADWLATQAVALRRDGGRG
ncbi:MAG: dockerin type I domain-containing protein [Planctomycetota bacterium]